MSEKAKHWVGFDLGGTKMLAKIFDDQFTEIASAKRKTEGNRGQKAGIARVVKTIEEALLAANLTSADLAGIGVGCPGPVNPEKGIILEAPNLGWVNVPIAKELQNAFGCPAVACNDVDAGVFAEYSFGAAKGARCAVGVFPGTGIGGGAVINGNLLEGSRISCQKAPPDQLGVGPVTAANFLNPRRPVAIAPGPFRGRAFLGWPRVPEPLRRSR